MGGGCGRMMLFVRHDVGGKRERGGGLDIGYK